VQHACPRLASRSLDVLPFALPQPGSSPLPRRSCLQHRTELRSRAAVCLPATVPPQRGGATAAADMRHGAELSTTLPRAAAAAASWSAHRRCSRAGLGFAMTAIPPAAARSASLRLGDRCGAANTPVSLQQRRHRAIRLLVHHCSNILCSQAVKPPTAARVLVALLQRGRRMCRAFVRSSTVAFPARRCVAASVDETAAAAALRRSTSRVCIWHGFLAVTPWESVSTIVYTCKWPARQHNADRARLWRI